MKGEENYLNGVNILENELDKIDDKIRKIKLYQDYHIIGTNRYKL